MTDATEQLTNQDLAWNDIGVAQLTFDAGENVVPPNDVHIFGIHTGAPLKLYQERDGKTVERTFVAGDLVFIPAGMENYCTHRDRASGLYISLKPQVVNTIADDIGMNGDTLSLGTNYGEPDPIVQQIGQALLYEQQTTGAGGNLYVQSLTQQITVHLLRRYATTTKSNTDETMADDDARQRIKPALDYIHAHLNQSLSVDDIAAVAHLTTYHFTRVFKQATGFTPHQYVIEQRVAQAVNLLQANQLSIAQVAVEVGFNDQSHLSRHIKRNTGFTPRQIQQSL